MKSLVSVDSLDIKSRTVQAKKQFEKQTVERVKTNKPSSKTAAAKSPPGSCRISEKGCVLAQQGPMAPWGQASGATGGSIRAGASPASSVLPPSAKGAGQVWASGAARRVIGSLGQLTENKAIERSFS